MDFSQGGEHKGVPRCEPDPVETICSQDTKTLNDCKAHFDHFKNFSNEPYGMKQIHKKITVWNQFWSEPKYILRDIIYSLALYGFVRGCMDLWSWVV